MFSNFLSVFYPFPLPPTPPIRGMPPLSPFSLHIMCPVDFLCRTPPTWSRFIFLVSMVTPNYIFIPEDFEIGALDERENPIFVFVGPGFLTRHNIIYFHPIYKTVMISFFFTTVYMFYIFTIIHQLQTFMLFPFTIVDLVTMEMAHKYLWSRVPDP